MPPVLLIFLTYVGEGLNIFVSSTVETYSYLPTLNYTQYTVQT